MKNKIIKFLSYFFIINITKVESIYNGLLEIKYNNGNLILDSKKANYSYGGLHKVFQYILKKYKNTIINANSILLLGLGGGSVVKILRKELGIKTKITAIDYDKSVFEIAEKNFHLSNFENLDIVNEDAEFFVNKTQQKFDVIIIDLFNDNIVPLQFLSKSFINSVTNLINTNGWLIFNFIPDNKSQNEDFNNLINILKSLNSKIEIEKKVAHNNTVLIWQKTNN